MADHDRRVAIIGAGPAGLVGARFLRSRGFEPVIFDRGARVGGQWDHAAATSAVWPDMSSNTSRIVTRFSDLDYPDAVPAFPHNTEVRAYLEAYAAESGLLPEIHLGTTVEEIARETRGGYAVTTTDDGGSEKTTAFSRVVIATGRYNAPSIPAIAGLDTFSGRDGLIHTFDYAGPGRLAGARVLVVGGSISALEVACDHARLGAAEVAIAMRRQRYVVPKLISGVPVDNVGLTRFGALAHETLPPEATAAALKAFITGAAGDPAAFGAATPAEDVFEAKIVLSQDYMPLLAEGRIRPKPWIERVDGPVVHFEDGTSGAFDAIILGTGFRLSLPFLSPEIRSILDLDDEHIDLADFTFHPDLDGLAFLGVYPLIGPYFPVLELQARYLAYSWSGAIPAPTRARRVAGIAAYRKSRNGPQGRLMHSMAIAFARLARVEPRPGRMPDLARALLFGPLSATSFRLEGPDSLSGAADIIGQEAARYGAVPDPSFTEAERERLAMLADARRDPELARVAGRP